MKKKAASLLLALVLLLSLAACGGKDPAPAPEMNPAASAPEPKEEHPPEAEPEEEPEKAPEEAPEEAKPVPEGIQYTFENGTLTCFGSGTITRRGWNKVVSEALFETDPNACAEAVENLVIEPGVLEIDREAFKGCINLGGELVIPGSVTKIGNEAFGGGGAFSGSSNALTSVVIPASVTGIGQEMFKSCWSLTSVSLPENLTEIPPGMFRDCRSLTSIEIPESVTQIGNWAFSDSPIEEITIPDGVTGIGMSAFSGCAIKELTIPASVTGWSVYALSHDAALTDVTILCEVTMDDVSRLLDPLFEVPGGLTRDSLQCITVHAASGSVVEGYINRRLEKEPGAADLVRFEAI